MNIVIILSILFLHWLSDFVLQTDSQARNKSSNWESLLGHTLVYSGVFLIATLAYGASLQLPVNILLFPLITFITHTAIDYYTSRVNKELWDKKNVHGFFVSVGFDQFLHVAQLLLTFKLLT